MGHQTQLGPTFQPTCPHPFLPSFLPSVLHPCLPSFSPFFPLLVFEIGSYSVVRAMWSRLPPSSQQLSCLSFSSARTAGMYHLAQQERSFSHSSTSRPVPFFPCLHTWGLHWSLHSITGSGLELCSRFQMESEGGKTNLLESSFSRTVWE